MAKATTSKTLVITHQMEEAWQAVDACFGRFCLTAGFQHSWAGAKKRDSKSNKETGMKEVENAAR